jgi:CubicO group peptidase (beta-lactamase class C family)
VRSRNGWVSLTPKPTYYRVAPAAGVNASASDMAQWLLAHTGHRPDVLPAPLLATLHSSLINTPGEMRSGWRRERLHSAGYAGWRTFDYAGHDVVFHAGAVQGYRGLVALVPERDLGIAIMWNGESGLPSGLLPTVLDSAPGLPAQRWLDVDTDFGSDNLMAEGQARRSRTSARARALRATARWRRRADQAGATVSMKGGLRVALLLAVAESSRARLYKLRSANARSSACRRPPESPHR